MGNVSTDILEWIEAKLSEIVEDDIGEEVSDVKIIDNLHDYCETDDDYNTVYQYLKEHPNASRNDICYLFLDIDYARKK